MTTTTTPTARQPVQRFRIGSITLAVWENTDKYGQAFFTTTLNRRYRGKDGQWLSSGSLRAVDLPVVRTLTELATQWLTRQETTQLDRHGLMTPAESPIILDSEMETPDLAGIGSAIQPANSR